MNKNRLKDESSPYLRQHADNPVDWYPWCKEAFVRAEKEGKPIFLSIGYSTCHWCHVMERESFSDEEVAELMNENFISIKVDREERPDIDKIYMEYARVMSGRGGWPLNIIMTPEKRPFFATTYIPKENRGNIRGMLELIPMIKDFWESRRGEVVETAMEATKAIKVQKKERIDLEPDRNLLNRTFDLLRNNFDGFYGGFGRKPKFPTPQNFLFLLRYWKDTDKDEALKMVKTSLERMRMGGIYDHIGHGFHRYSTDRKWKLPHFEKMLYVQALLLEAYNETYAVTGEDKYRRTCREIIEYLRRDMLSEEKGFYSAEDADSEGEEGKYYLWEQEEIDRILSGEERELFSKIYNIEEEGNFTEEATGKKKGRNILHLETPLDIKAEELGVDEDRLREVVESSRQKLLKEREERQRPLKDRKILTDWNSMVISALCSYYNYTGDESALTSARECESFIYGELTFDNGFLYHHYMNGESEVRGFLDDYAYLARAELSLYESTFDVRYLKKALDLTDKMMELFHDKESDGFFYTEEDSELPVRKKETGDTAYPSGNSVALLNLLKLGYIADRQDYHDVGEKMLSSLYSEVQPNPLSYTFLMVGLSFYLGEVSQLVITGERGEEKTEKMIEEVRSSFTPRTVTLFRPAGGKSPGIADIAEFTRELRGDSIPTAYLCRDFTCELPVQDIAGLKEKLQ